MSKKVTLGACHRIYKILFSLIGILILASPGYPQDLRDIKPPVDLPFNYGLWLIILGLLLLGLFILFYSQQKMKFFKPKPKPIVVRPPWDVALEQLNALDPQVFMAKNQIKEYYTQLSDIIRRYMEDRFQLRAPEMTTLEFLSSLKDSALLNDQQKILLKDILDSCDLVKFAKYSPSWDMARSFCLAAKSFVAETKPAVTSGTPVSKDTGRK